MLKYIIVSEVVDKLTKIEKRKNIILTYFVEETG